jgi:RNA polymerase sigma factor (sigma-70 family)
MHATNADPAPARPSLHAHLDTLYRDHQCWLRNWLTGRLGCRDVAEDLAQDTFTRLLTTGNVSGLHEPRAFLTTVAKGLMANWCRRQSLERAYLQTLATLPEPCAPSAEHQALVREALHQIDVMLDGLPAQARRVFLLSQFDGLDYAEIGRRMDISLSTVKRHMKRAFLGCLAHAP